MLEHTLKTARFGNNVKNVIIAEWIDNKDNTIVRPSHIAVDADDEQFKTLLTVTNLDEIEKNTIEYGKKEAERIKNMFKEIQSQTVVDNNQNDDSRVNEDLIEFVCKYNEEQDEHSEALFELKLAIFDLDEIANSTEDTLKESVRVAKTPFELICVLAESGLFSGLKKAAAVVTPKKKKTKKVIDSNLDSE